MNYLSTSTFSPKLAPEAIFHLRKMSHGRRMQYNQMGAPIFQKLAELDRERQPHQEEVERAEAAAKIEPCSCAHPASADGKDTHDETTRRCTVSGCKCRKAEPSNDAYAQLHEINNKQLEALIDELTPVKVRWGVSAIEGLTIDGEPATVDTFLSTMPDELISEVASEIERLMKLSGEETLAFKSPTTGGAAVAGENPSSIAPLADAKSLT